MVTISFPGIGIDNFTVSPVAFSLFGLEVRWYGIIITTGIILAVLYAMYRAKQEGITTDDLLDITIYTVIFGIIGARLYYVLTSLSEYHSIGEAIAIWNGGLAIYGAIIAGAITICVVCRIKKISVAKTFDMVSPAVMIGQILGRWGNFFNGEAHGGVVPEDSPLYFIRMGLSTHNIENIRGMAYVHPTFLYESVWNLVGFFIINALYKKKKFDGQIFIMYLTWYGFGRMLIEGLRTDSLYVGVFRISQVVGFVCFVGGSVLLIYNLIKARRAALSELDYEPTYSKFSQALATDEKECENNEAESNEDDAAEEKSAYEKRLDDLLGGDKPKDESEGE